MKLYVVSVRDRAADCFGRPMFVPNVALAVRSFQDEVNREDRENQLFGHPEDFDLYLMAEFDDNSGQFVQSEVHPRMVAIGKDLKR